METVIKKKPPQDTDLEAIRTAVLSNTENLEELCESVCICTKNIHASYLFVTYNGMRAAKAICLFLSSTQDQMIPDWKELGALLGLSCNEIKTICTYMYYGRDGTELTLRTFAQYPDSTIETIIRALYKMHRHDAIREAKQPLEDLARELSGKQVSDSHKLNCNYTSHIDVTDTLIRPKDYTQLFELTLPLKDIKMLDKDIKFKTRLIQNEVYQKSSLIGNSIIQRQSQSKYSRTVMLTFAADGEDIARKIAVSLRASKVNNNWPIGVLLLSDHQERVECNPEQFILHFFPKMDFIVPILTEEYFRALNFKDVLNVPSGCVDCRYVPFIHDLMTKYYVKNSCKNKKIRCIIPDMYFSNVISNPHFCNDPILQVYEKESQINLLATRMLNASV